MRRRAGTRGSIKKITAIDRLTVEFQLCAPDVGVPAEGRVQRRSAIQDADYLAAHAPDKSILDAAQRHRALQAQGVGARATGSSSRPTPTTGATSAKTPNARAPLERRGRRAAARAPVRAPSTASTTPAPTDIDTIKGDSTLAVLPARRAEHLLPRLQQHGQKPWDDERGPPGDRHGHRPRADRQELLPGRLRGRRRTSRRAPIAVRLRGRRLVRLRRRRRPRSSSTERRLPDFSKTYKLSVPRRGPRLPPGPAVIATEIQGSSRRTSASTPTLDLQESGAYPRRRHAAGTLEGISCLIGWGADYPDPTNFLDYHFGSGSGKKFGAPFHDIAAALHEGRSRRPTDAARKAAYTEANNLIKQHVPAVIIAHGASGDGVQGRRRRRPRVAARQRGLRRRCRPADRDTLVFDAERRAAQPVLRRRDRRRERSARASRSTSRCTRYKIGGTDAGARPGHGVQAERRRSRPGPASSATASSSTTARRSTPTTSSPPTRSQWDAKHPLHKGRAERRSSTGPACGAASSTRRHRLP